MRKYIISNNRIRAREVRLVDKDGNQLGVVGLSEALRKSREAGLDLIQVTEKVDPPVCKIMEYGKYAYTLGKKEKQQTHHQAGELKSIRLTFGISEHDMQTRAKSTEKFFKKGSKVRIEMRLKGRQKALGQHAREKIEQFLGIVKQTTPIKIERELRRMPNNLSMIISKQQ